MRGRIHLHLIVAVQALAGLWVGWSKVWVKLVSGVGYEGEGWEACQRLGLRLVYGAGDGMSTFGS